MNRANHLARMLGDNMSESMGVRGEAASDATSLQPSSALMVGQGPEEGRSRDRRAGLIDLSRVVPDPDQPRKAFDEESLEHLTQSLRTAGQLQPIRVRWSKPLGKWVIISGERRYRAAIRAGFVSIACQFVDHDLGESEIRQQSLMENLLRDDLKPIEAAQGYRQLMDLNGWTMQQVADALSVAKGTVSKALSLLKLPDDIRAQVEDGIIAPTAAYEISRVEGEGAQRELARKVVVEGLKRDDAGQLAGKAKRARTGAAKPQATRVFMVTGAKVSISWAGDSAGPGDVIAALEEAIAQAHSTPA